MIEVLQPGLLTTVQDAGRRGYEAYGVPRSGVMDSFLACIANKLAGNPRHAPLLEFALTGPALHFHDPAVISCVGLNLHYELDGRKISSFESVVAHSGSVLRFVSFDGWFGYIAIGGGIGRERILGSASTYVAGAIGHRLEKQEQLKIGSGGGPPRTLKDWRRVFPPEPVVYLLPGQHTHLFDSDAMQNVAGKRFRISPQSNRMGIRMEGSMLEAPVIRRSSPVIPGTVQVPRSGSPIILGPEGPTTGGYAQLGVISHTSWTTIASIRPGREIEFAWTEVDQAREMTRAREAVFHSAEAWPTL